ncbi:MAG: hypothetical protein GXO39_06295 [Thermotogae bacterium]|nr:hypothetical protein [Thermotogota bacterium]
MLWLLRILNVLILIWGTVAFFSVKEQLPFALAGAGFLFFVSAIYKSYTIGSNTLRGRFWMIFSLVGLFIGLAGLLHSMYSISMLLHALSRLALAASILMMFLGLVRRGMLPRGWRMIVTVLAFLLSIGAVFYAMGHSASTSVWDIVIGISDVVVFTFTVANLMVYLGSDLGRRWLIGFLAMFVYTIADLMFLMDRMDPAMYTLVISLFLISIVAHLEE